MYREVAKVVQRDPLCSSPGFPVSHLPSPDALVETQKLTWSWTVVLTKFQTSVCISPVFPLMPLSVPASRLHYSSHLPSLLPSVTVAQSFLVVLDFDNHKELLVAFEVVLYLIIRDAY